MSRSVRTRHEAALLVLPLLVLGLTLGCVINPVTGRREILVVSPAEEAATGERAAAQVAAEMGLLSDEALTAYVRAIGARLAPHSPRQSVPLAFHVVDVPEVNAFALPGGYIYVSRGLLALANDEDELANVIAHEIGHIAARHHAQRQTRAIGVGLLSTIGSLAAAIAGGAEAAAAITQIGQAAGAGLIASYSRHQEHEADEVGQEIASHAGYDPAAMSRFLRSLDRQTTEMMGRRRRPGFLDSHPSTPDRISQTAGRARGLVRARANPVARGRSGFLHEIAGIVIGDDPAQGVFVGSAFLHPDLDVYLRFPAEWPTQNTPSAVAAINPKRSVLIRLETGGGPSTAVAAAREFLASQPFQVLRAGRRLINGLGAYHAVLIAPSQRGNAGIEVVWIESGARVYRISCMTQQAKLEAYSPLCRKTFESFRPLTAKERRSIKRRVLDLATAHGNEPLADFAKRTHSAWTAAELATANGLIEFDPLRAGALLKIAREETYH